MCPFAIDSHPWNNVKKSDANYSNQKIKHENNPRVYIIGFFPTNIFNYLGVKGDSLLKLYGFFFFETSVG